MVIHELTLNAMVFYEVTHKRKSVSVSTYETQCCKRLEILKLLSRMKISVGKSGKYLFDRIKETE